MEGVVRWPVVADELKDMCTNPNPKLNGKRWEEELNERETDVTTWYVTMGVDT